MGSFQDMDIAALRAGTVDEIKAQLPNLDGAALQALRAAEIAEGEGKTRRSAIAAIDDAIGKRMVTDGAALSGQTATNETELQAMIDGNAGASMTADSQEDLERMAAGDAGGTESDAIGAGAVIEEVAEPTDLSGMTLTTLQSLRQMAVEQASGDQTDGEVLRIDAAIADLVQKAKDTPAIDPNKTETRAVAVPAAHDLVMSGGAYLAFSEGADLVRGIAPMATEAKMWSMNGGRPTFERKLTLSRDVPAATITHALLMTEDSQIVATCEIPGGLRAGGGMQAEFPAGFLRF